MEGEAGRMGRGEDLRIVPAEADRASDALLVGVRARTWGEGTGLRSRATVGALLLLRGPRL